LPMSNLLQNSKNTHIIYKGWVKKPIFMPIGEIKIEIVPKQYNQEHNQDANRNDIQHSDKLVQ